MAKKIEKQGDKFVLNIDKKILEDLHIDEKTELDITTQGNKIIVEKSGRSISDRNFEKVLDQYGDVFKKLSKT